MTVASPFLGTFPTITNILHALMLRRYYRQVHSCSVVQLHSLLRADPVQMLKAGITLALCLLLWSSHKGALELVLCLTALPHSQLQLLPCFLALGDLATFCYGHNFHRFSMMPQEYSPWKKARLIHLEGDHE